MSLLYGLKCGLKYRPISSISSSISQNRKLLFQPNIKFNIRNYANQYRPAHQQTQAQKRAITDGLLYGASVVIIFVGLTYASVPLYRMFCSATGIGGTPQTHSEKFDPQQMKPLTDSRRLRIRFMASVSNTLDWQFAPQQREVVVVPGESSLAFYTAKNMADKDLIGVSTYNVVPQQAGPYFNKIQCFCFEEQKLQPGEEVDMPVFFFIDPEILDDPVLRSVDTISLSYTFFKSREV